VNNKNKGSKVYRRVELVTSTRQSTPSTHQLMNSSINSRKSNPKPGLVIESGNYSSCFSYLIQSPSQSGAKSWSRRRTLTFSCRFVALFAMYQPRQRRQPLGLLWLEKSVRVSEWWWHSSALLPCLALPLHHITSHTHTLTHAPGSRPDETIETKEKLKGEVVKRWYLRFP